ncbi:MAG: MBL fold metallo-hydrolase [Bacteroidota bacterium]
MSAPSPVVPGLWRIELGVANAYLLESADGPILIDTGTPGSEAAILRALAARRHAPEAVRHIVVTHHHPDHAGALAALLDATGAEAYMHPLDAAEVRVGSGFRPYRPASGILNWALERVFIRPTPRRYTPAEVAREVADGDVLPGGLTAVHAPGHSAGQIALLWPEQGGVLIAADACSNLPVLTLSIIYEDLDVGRETLRRLGGLDFDAAVFGHGKPMVGRADERFRKAFGA